MLVAGDRRLARLAAEGGAEPSVVAGHSLGEYSALVASGVLTLAQAAPLVRFRAQAMQQAVPVGVGAMAAVLGMEAAKVQAGCAEAHGSFGPGSAEVVEAVNFNDPMQTVIAGQQGGGRQGLRGAEGQRRQARAAAAGLRAFPFEPDEAGGRGAARAAGLDAAGSAPDSGRQQHRCRGRNRSGPHPRRPGAPGVRVRCAGSRPCRPSRRAVSRPSSNAARARCWPAWPSASRRPGRGLGLRPGDARRNQATARRLSAIHRFIMSIPKFEGQVALVTGATRGIGAAIALELAQPRPQGHRHRHHRRRRRQDHRRTRGLRRPGLRAGRQRRRRRRGPGRRDRQGVRRASTCWSTTPASRATRSPCG